MKKDRDQHSSNPKNENNSDQQSAEFRCEYCIVLHLGMIGPPDAKDRDQNESDLEKKISLLHIAEKNKIKHPDNKEQQVDRENQRRNIDDVCRKISGLFP